MENLIDYVKTLSKEDLKDFRKALNASKMVDEIWQNARACCMKLKDFTKTKIELKNKYPANIINLYFRDARIVSKECPWFLAKNDNRNSLQTSFWAVVVA